MTEQPSPIVKPADVEWGDPKPPRVRIDLRLQSFDSSHDAHNKQFSENDPLGAYCADILKSLPGVFKAPLRFKFDRHPDRPIDRQVLLEIHSPEYPVTVIALQGDGLGAERTRLLNALIPVDMSERWVRP